MNEFKSWEEMSELEQLSCTFWDFYKEAHGVRPRHVNTSGWTVEDYRREFEVLSSISAANAAQRRSDQERAAHDLEVRIQSLMGCGAKDREMAIRWLDEAHESDGDLEYLCFLLGVDYGYFGRPYL